MFQTLVNFFRVADIRKKIFFTLAMLLIFRIGTFIPVPGINASALQQQMQGGILGFLNTFNGGALKNFSVLAMGVMPYITSSIIVQLLQMDVVPKLAEWAKQGEMGRKKLNQLTRYLTIILGLVEAFGMAFGFNQFTGAGLIENPTFATYLVIAVVLTAGTMFLMWLGEQITVKGIGNGVSIIIFAGIVSRIPDGARQLFVQRIEGANDQLFLRLLELAGIAVAIIAIVVVVIYFQQANRKIPIQYSKRVAGAKQGGAQATHLPLKLNSAGVIPVIFASAFIITPQTIISFFAANNTSNTIKILKDVFDYTKPIGMILYVVLIVAFTYFYAFIQVNPEKVADNLKKQGGYIPSKRPGRETQAYLTSVLYRLTFIGAIFLAVVAVLPTIGSVAFGLPQALAIGGTSLLIVIGVALDTTKQLEGQLVKRNYRGFIK
ncbi:preprotein translocase subunit SecY [Listeria grayi]|uniref:Protein translocase subunit SecY n=3 Tax=Listeria grayi TaxID=1641 RepID=D7UUC4_LISGR|nr:preprotein translocase subunit SecY [Listeria grayi]EFI85231.1 preprotein translocase, SecY subunit [Listeria grayi DSM 20601]MBC1922918.1 preprotein translocase subunit SecY [Listeria grayi]STY44541.1 preprotein translocase subunit SecY [Listeria grayi]VEI36578.1 preprotein translocase subunit SecY [Listeria grayi]